MAGDLPIQELGPKGDGIHDSQRGRIYVDRALPGETVQAKIRRGDDGVLRGDLVEICDAAGSPIARGVTNYDSAAIEKIKGRKTAEIETILGQRPYDEIVHRDNMAFLSATP